MATSWYAVQIRTDVQEIATACGLAMTRKLVAGPFVHRQAIPPIPHSDDRECIKPMKTNKLFYADTHLTEFSAVVVDCFEGKNGFEVELDQTAFYPEGGGQAADRGTLNGVPVLHVREDGERVLHLLEKPLAVGETVTGTLEGGQTLAFMVLALSQVVQSFNMRSQRSLFAIGPFTNSKLNGAALISTALVALVLFTPVKVAFGLVTLPGRLYLAGLGLILVPLVVMELSKLVEPKN